MKDPVNPFPTTGYYGPKYFCDRVGETKTLVSNLKGGQSTVLTAIRRMGKTALIKHVLGKLPRNWKTIYIDILRTEKESDLLEEFTGGILKSIPEKSGIGKKIWEFVKSWRPVFTFDPLSGMPQVTFDFKNVQTEKHISSLLFFLADQNYNFVIAIDEFQQILNYPEKNTDAWLRRIIQELPNIFFIFSGSQQHIMTGIFSDPGRPFYRSAQFLKIGRIPQEEYVEFINDQFKKPGKNISKEVIEEMLQWTDLHTYYVQLLCNRVFMNSKKEVNTQIWKNEALKLLMEQESIFYQYRELLTNPQWQLLKAIAGSGKVYEPTSSKFVSDFTLGNPATVYQSLEALQKKELIYKDFDQEGKRYYSVYDVLFKRWLVSAL